MNTITGWWEGSVFCLWVEDHEEISGGWTRAALKDLKESAKKLNIIIIDDETGKEI